MIDANAMTARQTVLIDSSSHLFTELFTASLHVDGTCTKNIATVPR